MSRIVYSIDWDWFTGAAWNVYCDSTLCGFPKCEKPPKNPATRTLKKFDRRNTIDRIITFFDQARFSSDAVLFVAENHASIYRLIRKDDRIYDWDSHVDQSPISRKHVNCSDWRTRAEDVKGARCLNRNQPRGMCKPADLVFLCKSSPWTPSCEDLNFCHFAGRLANLCHGIQFIGAMAPKLNREYKRRTFTD